MLRTVVIVAVALSALTASSYQSSSMSIGERVRIAYEQDRLLVEPHLAVRPANARHLLGAGILAETWFSDADRIQKLPNQRCLAFLSLDAGTTWTRHQFSLNGCYDPWVGFTSDGTAVAALLGAGTGLFVFRSADGGKTWDEEHPVNLGFSHDHSSMAIGRNLYVVSGQTIRLDDGRQHPSIYVAGSSDGGRTFREPVKIVPNDRDNLAEMGVVLSDGTVVVTFVHNEPEQRPAWAVRSTDNGRTFSKPQLISDVCGPPPVMQLSTMAADRSGRSFNDRIYFGCRQKAGGPIVVSFSQDKGNSWSAPVPVSAAPRETTTRRVPVVAVNNRGVLGVAWIEGRETGDRCEEVFFTASLDGGRTFLPERRVSSRPCSTSEKTTAIFRKWPTSGDYFGLASGSDGTFHLVWAESRAESSDLWTVPITISLP